MARLIPLAWEDYASRVLDNFSTMWKQAVHAKRNNSSCYFSILVVNHLVVSMWYTKTWKNKEAYCQNGMVHCHKDEKHVWSIPKYPKYFQTFEFTLLKVELNQQSSFLPCFFLCIIELYKKCLYYIRICMPLLCIINAM